MNYLLPARLADQRGVHPTLPQGPSCTHRYALPSPCSAEGDDRLSPSSQGRWLWLAEREAGKASKRPPACLPDSLGPDLDSNAKPSPLKKPSLGRPQKPFRTRLSHLVFPFPVAPGTLPPLLNVSPTPHWAVHLSLEQKNS